MITLLVCFVQPVPSSEENVYIDRLHHCIRRKSFHFCNPGDGQCTCTAFFLFFIFIFGLQRIVWHEAITSVLRILRIQDEEMKQGCLFRPTPGIQGCAWLAAPQLPIPLSHPLPCGCWIPHQRVGIQGALSSSFLQLIPSWFWIPTSQNTFFHHMWEADWLTFFGERGLFLTRQNVEQDLNPAFGERALCVHFSTRKFNWSSSLGSLLINCIFLLHFCYMDLFCSYSLFCTL